MTQLKREVLEASILGFESQKARIDAQIADVREMLNGTHQNGVMAEQPQPKTKTKKKRKLSPEGRANIVAAMKKRWAAKKAAAKRAAKNA